MQEKLFKVRDKRQRGWFWLDQEYFNGYAKIFGPIGLSVYLSLCRHADNETQECWPSMELIAEEIGVSRISVVRHLKKLEDFRIINVKREKDPQSNRQLNNVYTLTDKSEWKQKPGISKTHGKPSISENESRVSSPSISKIQELDSITILKELDSSSAQGAENATNALITLFKEVNPSYGVLFARPPQRAAADRLLKLHSLDWWERFMPAYVLALEDRFCPRATTPIKMEEKIGDIEHYGRSRKATATSKGNNYIL